ncbi:MAG: hypothetical protein V4577_12735 [Bacteroidota bacterium]
MKKISLLWLTFIIALTAAKAQTGWVDYKFDNKLSVKLPVQPQKYGQNSHSASTKDSTVCIVTMIDLKAATHLDSAALVAMQPTAEFAAGLKASMLGQQPDVVLGDIKTDKWNGNYCYTIEGSNAAKKLKTYTFMVVVNNNLYALNCLVPEKVSTKNKEYFFTSLKIN